ncbi:MAG TPA: DUF6252 family protein [Puia sp.]|nr:DUF6252 family protein [Puia sp.]
MKTIKSLFLGGSAGILLFIVSSCSKSNDGSTSTGTADSSAVFTATIDGTNWKADSVSALLDALDYQDKLKFLIITGYSGTKKIIIECSDTAIARSNDSTMSLATYAADSLSWNGEFQYFSRTSNSLTNNTWQQGGVASRGYTILSASDGIRKKVSGSFNFTAMMVSLDSTRIDTTLTKVNITNGVFKNIPYTYQ